MNPKFIEIREIIDEGFHPSVNKQLENCFGSEGTTAIYFRATDRPEVMLASTEPIPLARYMAWLKEKMEEEEGCL